MLFTMKSFLLNLEEPTSTFSILPTLDPYKDNQHHTVHGSYKICLWFFIYTAFNKKMLKPEVDKTKMSRF